FICEYPIDVELFEQCVVKLVDNNNQITLLSFGGYPKHTLVMKYVSVWSNGSNNDDENENEMKLNKSNNYNEYVPFTDNHNRPIIIGKDNGYYNGARAAIGGVNNHLLFITYPTKNNNNFQFHQLTCLFILFFGGWNFYNNYALKSVYEYSIRENKWMHLKILYLVDCLVVL
ncbi:hypothetical protein RFI_01435, partial [Reticulomyxa filosa]